MGLLVTDVKHDYLHSRVNPLHTSDMDQVNSMFREMETRGRVDMEREGFPISSVEVSRYLTMRYSGQAYELNVSFDQFPLTEGDKPLLRREFDAIHERSYGHKAEDASVEVVSYGLVSKVQVPKLSLPRYAVDGEGNEGAITARRRAYFEETGGYVEVPVYNRDLLSSGARIPGPAIIEQTDSTTVVYPGQRVSVDAFRNLVIDIEV